MRGRRCEEGFGRTKEFLLVLEDYIYIFTIIPEADIIRESYILIILFLQ